MLVSSPPLYHNPTTLQPQSLNKNCRCIKISFQQLLCDQMPSHLLLQNLAISSLWVAKVHEFIQQLIDDDKVVSDTLFLQLLEVLREHLQQQLIILKHNICLGPTTHLVLYTLHCTFVQSGNKLFSKIRYNYKCLRNVLSSFLTCLMFSLLICRQFNWHCEPSKSKHLVTVFVVPRPNVSNSVNLLASFKKYTKSYSQWKSRFSSNLPVQSCGETGRRVQHWHSSL